MELKIGIIILNWNGWKDTIECLSSIFLSDVAVRKQIILVDNHSSDESIEKIISWCEGEIAVEVGPLQKENYLGKISYEKLTFDRYAQVLADSELQAQYRETPLIIIENRENEGFAKGNNRGVALALQLNCSHVLLLNNDTTIMNNTLRDFSNTYSSLGSKVGALSCKIRYYDRPNIIWNSGANYLKYTYHRLYHKANAEDPVVGSEYNDLKQVNYVTGCAFYIGADILKNVGGLSEKVFYGSEDHEICLRLRKHGFHNYSDNRHFLFHKVGRSIGKKSKKNPVLNGYLHYLGLFIAVRPYFNKTFWYLSRYIYMWMVGAHLIIKYRMPVKRTVAMVRKVLRDSVTTDELTKERFELVVQGKYL